MNVQGTSYRVLSLAVAPHKGLERNLLQQKFLQMRFLFLQALKQAVSLRSKKVQRIGAAWWEALPVNPDIPVCWAAIGGYGRVLLQQLSLC
jgi:hypothetical protein